MTRDELAPYVAQLERILAEADAAPPADPPPAEGYEGRERWDVFIYCRDRTEAVPCGSLREGVSREIAGRVFEAVRRAASS